MARVKRAVNAQKKRRVILERASGYRGQRSRLYRKAKEQVTHSLVYAYRDRRKRKGDFRRLWIQRINAAARQNGITYNRFIQGLGLAGVQVDRRMLADLAVTDAGAFTSEGRAFLAVSTSEANVAGSFTASSASIRRSTCTPARPRPWMKRLYVMPFWRAAALMRWIHRRRKSPLRLRRSRYA